MDQFDFDPNFLSVGSTKCKHCGKIAFLCFVLVIVGALWTADYMMPQWNTENWAENHAVRLCHSEVLPTGGELDGWKNEFIMTVKVVDDPPSTQCTVRSLGRDGLYNTDDDIIASSVNYHKTTIISRWAGGKAKEALRGFVKGYKESE